MSSSLHALFAQSGPGLEEEVRRLRARVDALERERRRLIALLEILRDITGSVHYTDILQSVTRRMGHLFGLDRCSVFLAARSIGRTVHLVASYEDPSIRNHVVDLERYPELRRALETGQTVHIPDILAEPDLAPILPALAGRRVKSITVVPMRSEENVIGTLFLRTYEDGAVFTPEDIDFCRVVAEVTGRGLLHAHRLERMQAPGGTHYLLRADRQRAALIAYLRRLLGSFADRDPAMEEGLLARASSGELDRLVGVALTVLNREARAP
ncbi:MAG TPA: GAF domain-containing protein [Gemmatimonadales bacterium]